MDLVNAIIMGLVEGVTEFLPISSTGHLIIVADFFKFLTEEKRQVFEIFIQMGAILAVCWHYRQKLFEVAINITAQDSARYFVLQIFIAFLPLALLGLLLHKAISAYLFFPIPVALALIIGGILIWIIESLKPKVRIHELSEISVIAALKIGLLQALALIPGVSRSGATILGGVCLGISRKVATEFSFFLAIPTILSASIYQLWKFSNIISGEEITLFVIGLLTSFISALCLIRMFLYYVAKYDFKPFAYYRIVLGTIILMYFW